MSWLGIITDWYSNSINPSIKKLSEISHTQGYLVATGQAFNWFMVWFTCSMVTFYTKLETLYHSYQKTATNKECRIFRIAHNQASTSWRTGTSNSDSGLDGSGSTCWSTGTPKILEELELLRTVEKYHNITNIRINFRIGDRRGVRYLEKGDTELLTLSPKELTFSNNPKRKVLCGIRKRDTDETDITDVINQYLSVESNRIININALEQYDYKPLFQDTDQLMIIDTEAKQHTIDMVTDRPTYFVISINGTVEITSDINSDEAFKPVVTTSDSVVPDTTGPDIDSSTENIQSTA